MCGRYAQSADMRELMEQFEVTDTIAKSFLDWDCSFKGERTM